MADRPEFQVQLKGAGVCPKSVRASDLAEFLEQLDGAITETAKGQQIGLAYEPDAVIVSLVQVAAGSSSDLTLSVERPISPAVSAMTEAIATRRFAAIPWAAQGHLHELSKQAIYKHWVYEFVPVNGVPISRAVISYEFPVPAPAEPTVSGPTILWGHLIKVGGRVPKATIRQRNGELLSVDISRDLAQELGKLIDHDIGIEGEARWRLGDGKILTFKGLGVAGYRPDEVSLTQTFQDLARASQGRWDGVDAAEYVKKLRYEDEP
jgi:hypothetical protein